MNDARMSAAVILTYIVYTNTYEYIIWMYVREYEIETKLSCENGTYNIFYANKIKILHLNVNERIQKEIEMNFKAK